jgi:hypothetical protein
MQDSKKEVLIARAPASTDRGWSRSTENFSLESSFVAVEIQLECQK